MGAKAGEVAARVIQVVGNHVYPRKLGKVFSSDCGYLIFPQGPKRVRFPDVSFIAKGRLPEDKTPDGHVKIPPDLGVEVVSPRDTAEGIEERRGDFLRAGTRLFWVIYPMARTVHIYRPSGDALVLDEGGELKGDEVLPDFACRVSELFEET